ncbi:unnamed protein product, partial [marine sediment metagenome]
MANRTFRNFNFKPSISEFGRFFQGITKIVITDGIGNNFWPVSLIRKLAANKPSFAVFAIIKLSKAE